MGKVTDAAPCTLTCPVALRVREGSVTAASPRTEAKPLVPVAVIVSMGRVIFAVPCTFTIPAAATVNIGRVVAVAP